MGDVSVEMPMSAEEMKKNKDAFESVLPEYRKIPDGNLRPLRTKPRKAAATALGVWQRVNQPDWRSVYTKLSPDLFDQSALVQLEPAARSVLYLCAQGADLEALATEAVLPASLVVDASETRTRMLKLAAYHLGETAEVGPLIETIVAGKGHLDLAEDLWRLAEIYRANLAVISKDPTHYRVEDPENAERLAKRIEDLVAAATAPKQKEQKELVARAWTFLVDTYEKVAKPGRWLFDGKGAEIFVSLHTAGRRPLRRSAKKQSALGQAKT